MTHRRLLTKAVKFSKRERLPSGPHLAWRIESGFVRSIALEQANHTRVLGIWGPKEYVCASLSQHFSCQLECLTAVTLEPVSLKNIDRTPLFLRYIRQTEILLDIALKRQVGDRLIDLFSWLSTQFGEERERGQLISVPLTHQDIADVIGTSREAVTRIMRVMEESRQIYYEERLIIFNRSAIENNKPEK